MPQYKGTIGKTNWALGEISPRSLGRFDPDKPIWKAGAKILENLLIGQACSLSNRPGTQYIAPIKDQTQKACLRRFTYSISQEYIMEIGNRYIRFYSNVNNVPGQVIVSGSPAWVTGTGYVVGQYVTQSAQIYYCLIAHTSGTFATDLAAGKWVLQNILEIPTIFQQADIFNLQMANKADVMYIVNSNYYPQKIVRTSATSFSIFNVPFVRGPFLDSNTTAITITPSAATGTAITLTASSGIFQLNHVGALWRVKDGVVKITGFSTSTSVVGDVQAEPDGTPGNLGGTAAYTDWAEGAFSLVRGFPASVAFHEGRLVYGGTAFKQQTIYASAPGIYDDFSAGTGEDGDAYTYEISSNQANGIRWLASDTALKIGTAGGTMTAADGNAATGITPTSPPQITNDNNYGAMYQQPVMLGGYLFYIQANQLFIRQLTFDFYSSKYKAINMMLLADHILRDGLGVVQVAAQSSPYDRIWAIRNDGQIAVFMRDVDQQVEGWSRIIGGESDFTITCNGLSGGFESIEILPIDGRDDQIWVICYRRIGGVYKRFVEVFTPELFNNYWEPVRLDASLSYDQPIGITAISNTSPIVVTAPSHGFGNGDQVKITGVDGLGGTLNDQVFVAQNVTANTFELWYL